MEKEKSGYDLFISLGCFLSAVVTVSSVDEWDNRFNLCSRGGYINHME